MLNVSEINNNNASSITYLVDSYYVWHGKLENRNCSYGKKMVNVSLITKLSLENHKKCELCVESKVTKKNCKTVDRELKLLSLIYCDLKDLKNTITRYGKRFYINFIDYYLKYIKVYLLINNNEVGDTFIKYKTK